MAMVKHSDVLDSIHLQVTLNGSAGDDVPCFILTVVDRWLRGVFGQVECLELAPEQAFVYHLPGRPHPALVPGSRALWVNRTRPSSGAGESRFLGHTVMESVRCGTPGELLYLYEALPSVPRSVIYRLAADAGGF